MKPLPSGNSGQVPAEVDVVVVGGGGAGLAAAVSARERGVEVLLLEKQDNLGGTTALSIGSISAAGTRLQQLAGIKDSAEAFAEDMWRFDPGRLTGDAPGLRMLLATEAATSVAWLEGHGVAFSGPYPEPPHRVPRMHNVIPNSRVYIRRLSEAASRLGVAVVTGAEVAGLTEKNLADGSRQVVGLTLRQGSTIRSVRARKGVILASGDFSGNAEMRERYLPPPAAAARPINPSSNGDGHRMGTAVGAHTMQMDVILGPQLRFLPPPVTGIVDRLPTWRSVCQLEAALVRRLPPGMLRPFVKSLLITHMSPSADLFTNGAMLVNARGERFGTTESSVTTLSSQPEGKGWILMDERVAARFNTEPHAISTAPGIAFAYFDDYQRGRPDLIHRAAPAELAARCGFDATALAESLAASALSTPLIAIGPCYSSLTVTEGGLAVDSALRVLDADGSPIPGLYAAGSVAQGGMVLMGHGHHIAWAMTSGRIAGEQAARLLPGARQQPQPEPSPLPSMGGLRT